MTFCGCACLELTAVLSAAGAMNPILVYYWLTPIFWIVDAYFGANLRTAALEGHPWWKAAYYLFCIVIAVLATVVPDRLPRLGQLEAGLNIVLLVAAVMIPYYGFVDAVAMGDVPMEPPLTLEKMINFIIASVVGVAALKANASS